MPYTHTKKKKIELAFMLCLHHSPDVPTLSLLCPSFRNITNNGMLALRERTEKANPNDDYLNKIHFEILARGMNPDAKPKEK